MTEIKISDLSALAARPADDDLFVIVDISEPLDVDKTKKVTFANLESPVKIIAVKYAEFTGTQSADVTAGSNIEITDLSITHSLAKSTNKLLLISMVVGASNEGSVRLGTAIAVDGTLVNTGAADGDRSRVTTYGRVGTGTINTILTQTLITEYEPGATLSKIYTVRAINVSGSTQTIYINRDQQDSNAVGIPRSYSMFYLIELEG